MKHAIVLGAAAAMLIAQPATAQRVQRVPPDAVRDLATIYGARGAARAAAAPQAAAATPGRPQSGAAPQRMQLPQRDYGYADYGRVSGGYPEYGSPEFPAGQNQEAADRQPATEAEEQAEDFTVSEGFFFDNYTSGSGFGVYGGEAVSSGSGDPRITLRSAGQEARNLGLLPDGFAQGGGQTTPPPPGSSPQ